MFRPNDAQQQEKLYEICSIESLKIKTLRQQVFYFRLKGPICTIVTYADNICSTTTIFYTDRAVTMTIFVLLLYSQTDNICTTYNNNNNSTITVHLY